MSGLDAALVDSVRIRLASAGATSSGLSLQVAAAVRAEGAVLGDAALIDLVSRMQSEISGLGLLAPLVRDRAVTDVLVHGSGEVWIDRGSGVEPTAVCFPDEAAVRRLAVRIAAAAGRRLDDACPFVDVRLADGLRFHALLTPLAVDGTCLSLRVPARTPWTLAQWVEAGSMPPALAQLLRDVVRARLSFLVSGGTGTGKTTLLSTLLGQVDSSERLVVVEDTTELAPDHPQVVRLEARPANVEGLGGVSLRDLVRQALRMRPDRLFVGEVRGAEVVDLLAALNTGHEGGGGTVHANALAETPARLESLALSAGLGRAALHSQLAAGVDVVIQLARARSGQRRVAAVGLLQLGPASLVEVVPAWTFDSAGRFEAGLAAEALAARLADRLETAA